MDWPGAPLLAVMGTVDGRQNTTGHADERALIPPRMTREQVAVKGIPRDQLRGFPDIGQDELVRFFTLMPADVEFVASRCARKTARGLGLAVQLCTLRGLGFVPDEVRAAPPVAVVRLGARLKVDPGVLAGSGGT